MKENLNKDTKGSGTSVSLDGVRLSPHFMLKEFLNLSKYPENIPTMQTVVKLQN